MANSNFLRTFAKFFTNLTRDQQSELERAFHDVENSKEITSLETSLELLRRKQNFSLPIPQLKVYPTVRGAQVEWEALDDQRINFYEIDISTTNTFAEVTTTTTLGTYIVIDGLTASKFIRVRGVRRDGTTSPYSDTVTVSPEIFAIRSHYAEAFYIPITGTSPNLILGGPSSTLSFTPINPDGESLVWGFLSVYGDPAVGLFGLDRIFCNVVVTKYNASGAFVSETIEWTNTYGEYFNSVAVGPFTVSHPELNGSITVSLYVNDISTKADGSARTNNNSEVFWSHLNVLELGSIK